MLPSDTAMLSVVRDNLARKIAPETHGETRKLLESGVRMALEELLHRGGAGVPQLRKIHEDLLDLTVRYNGLAASWPQGALQPVPEPPPLIGQEDFGALAARIDAVRGALVAQAAAVAAGRTHPQAPKAWADAARGFLIDLTRNELDEISREAPAGLDAASDRLERNRARLEASMAKGLGQPGLKLTGHRRVSGGFSRDTFIVSAEIEGEAVQYVIRAAVEGVGYLDAIYRSVSEEFPLLQLARRCGVPTPEVYYLEADETVIGSRFILMEHCRGAAVGNTMYALERPDLAVFPKLAAMLANLHNLPWAENIEVFPQMAGRTRMTVAESTEMFLAKNRRWMASGALRPSAVLTLAVDWLARNIPPNDAQAQFIHGDVGFHNMLIDGADISAVLDWEGGAVGNPAWDLVAARLMLDERVSWEQFAAWYVEAGGKLPREDELEYWMMMRTLSGNITCALALEKMFEVSSRPDYLELGIGARPFFLGHFLENASRLWESRP